MVGIRLVERSELIEREWDICRQIRNNTFRHGPAQEGGCFFQRLDTLLDQRVYFFSEEPGHLAPVRQAHHGDGARLIEPHDDIAMRDQFLDLKRVHPTESDYPGKKNKDGITGLVVCDGRGCNSIGSDISEVSKEKFWEMGQPPEGGRHDIGIFDIRGARGRWLVLGRVPNLRHKLTMVIWVGGVVRQLD